MSYLMYMVSVIAANDVVMQVAIDWPKLYMPHMVKSEMHDDLVTSASTGMVLGFCNNI